MTDAKNPTPNQAQTPATDLPEQLRIRRDKRAKLLAAGVEAYPVEVPRTHTLAQVRDQWGHLEPGEETQDVVTVVGRVIFVRNTGKLCFATLQEGDGTQLQAMLSLKEVGEDALAAWKADVDMGDFVIITGRVIASRRGELSVMATEWTMASKSLRPLPFAHSDMSEDQRVRHRYTDLIMRPEARDNAITRIKVIRELRHALERRGFLEVETPMLQTQPGGAAARPDRKSVV